MKKRWKVLIVLGGVFVVGVGYAAWYGFRNGGPLPSRASLRKQWGELSLAYMPEIERPVYVDGHAEWIESRDEQRRVWNLHASIPPPLGFDPEPHYGSIDHHHFGLLRITPWRIELGDLYGEPVIWRP